MISIIIVSGRKENFDKWRAIGRGDLEIVNLDNPIWVCGNKTHPQHNWKSLTNVLEYTSQFPEISYLDFTLRSIEMNSYKDVEVVIVDAFYNERRRMYEDKFDYNVIHVPDKGSISQTNKYTDEVKAIDKRMGYDLDTVSANPLKYPALAGARNTGIIHSHGDLLLLIDDTTILPPQHLQRFYDVSKKGFDCFAPEVKIKLMNNRLVIIGDGIANFHDCNAYEDVLGGYGWGYCQSISTERILTLNGYSEDYDGSMGMEDVDFKARAERLYPDMCLNIQDPIFELAHENMHKKCGYQVRYNNIMYDAEYSAFFDDMHGLPIELTKANVRRPNKDIQNEYIKRHKDKYPDYPIHPYAFNWNPTFNLRMLRESQNRVYTSEEMKDFRIQDSHKIVPEVELIINELSEDEIDDVRNLYLHTNGEHGMHECLYLYYMAKQAKVGIFEIGCLYGLSSNSLAKGSLAGNKVNVTSNDLFVHGSHPEDWEFTRVMFPHSYHLMNLIVGDSTEIEFNKKIDLIFIDGDHDSPTVINDVKKFNNNLVDGGHMILHDAGYPGVNEAIDYIRDELKWENTSGYITTFRKSGDK